VTRSPLLIELKGFIDINTVLNKINNVNTDILIQSFQPEYLSELSDNFDGSIGILSPSQNQKERASIPNDSIANPKKSANFINNIGGDFISINYKNCTRSFVNSAHTKGLDVYVWTIRDSDIYQKVKSLRVDGVILDSLSYI
jgi:glycerophosphoryl diester phosphodiesterase